MRLLHSDSNPYRPRYQDDHKQTSILPRWTFTTIGILQGLRCASRKISLQRYLLGDLLLLQTSFKSQTSMIPLTS